MNFNFKKFIIAKFGISSTTASVVQLAVGTIIAVSIAIIALNAINNSHNQNLPDDQKIEISKLDIPANINFEHDTLTWDSVLGANSYKVSGDVPEIIINTTSYEFKDLNPGKYIVNLTAIGDQKTVIDSDTATIDIIIERKSLYTLKNVRIDKDTLLWDKLEKSSGYIVDILIRDTILKSINIPSPNTTSLYLGGLNLNPGNYDISIYGKGNNYYLDSLKYSLQYQVINNSNNTQSPQDNKDNTDNSTEDEKLYLDDLKNVNIQDGILRWDKLENSSGYIIDLQQNQNIFTYYIDENGPYSLSIFNINGLNPGICNVTIYALGNDKYYNSKPVNLSYNLIKLNTPINLSFSNKILRWDAVDGANYYEIKIDNQSKIDVSDSSYTFTNIIYPGTHKFTVRAISNVVDVIASNEAILKYDEGKWEISDPTNLKVTSGVFSWDSVLHATKYKIEIESLTGQKIKIDETIQLQYNIYNLDLNLGEYKLCVTALGDDIYGNSNTVKLNYTEEFLRECRDDTKYLYPTDPKKEYVQFRNFYSIKNDLVLDSPDVQSLEELNILYRTFLTTTNEEEKNQAALKIGNDIMFTYYYINKFGIPINLNTTGGIPLVKNKMWSDWIYYFDPTTEKYEILPGGQAGTSVGCVVPKNISILSLGRIANPEYSYSDIINSKELSIIRNNSKDVKLYVDINIISKDESGSVNYYKKTFSTPVTNP